MITYWPDKNKRNEFKYELTPLEGNLIYRIIKKLSDKDLKKMDFTDEEIDKINRIYQSF